MKILIKSIKPNPKYKFCMKIENEISIYLKTTIWKALNLLGGGWEEKDKPSKYIDVIEKIYINLFQT